MLDLLLKIISNACIKFCNKNLKFLKVFQKLTVNNVNERLIMYEQSQIILDGELLGNNVIINRPFESIYEISPLIIKNFINIINENSSISKPVRIKKYYFAQNNCINIVFKNKIAF